MTISNVIHGLFFKTTDAAVVPALPRLLQTDDYAARNAVTSIMAALSQNVKMTIASEPANEVRAAVVVLTGMLRDENPYVRYWSARALRLMSPGTEEAVHELTERLRDTVAMVRGAAAETLGLFGPLASGAIPELSQSLADEEANVRKAAAKALELIRKQRSGDDNSGRA